MVCWKWIIFTLPSRFAVAKWWSVPVDKTAYPLPQAAPRWWQQHALTFYEEASSARWWQYWFFSNTQEGEVIKFKSAAWSSLSTYHHTRTYTLILVHNSCPPLKRELSFALTMQSGWWQYKYFAPIMGILENIFFTKENRGSLWQFKYLTRTKAKACRSCLAIYVHPEMLHSLIL